MRLASPRVRRSLCLKRWLSADLLPARLLSALLLPPRLLRARLLPVHCRDVESAHTITFCLQMLQWAAPKQHQADRTQPLEMDDGAAER